MVDEAGDDLDHRPLPGLSRQQAADHQMARLREDLYEDTVFGIRAIARWSQVEPDQEHPPESWVAEVGPERAREMLQIARAAHKPTREAPAGLKMTVDIYRGLENARATDKLGRVQVGVQVIVGPAPEPLPSMLIESSED